MEQRMKRAGQWLALFAYVRAAWPQADVEALVAATDWAMKA